MYNTQLNVKMMIFLPMYPSLSKHSLDLTKLYNDNTIIFSKS